MTILIAPKALAARKVRNFEMLIGGKWVPAVERAPIERVAPSHGVVVRRYQAGWKADTERAITDTFNLQIGGRTGWWMPQQPK